MRGLLVKGFATLHFSSLKSQMIWLRKFGGLACTSGAGDMTLLQPYGSQTMVSSTQKEPASSGYGFQIKKPAKVAQTLPFRELKKNQIGRILRGSTFKKIEAVHLNANNPIEDSFCVGVSGNMNFAIFSVFDGHGGRECSQYLQNNLSQEISKNIHSSCDIHDDFQVLLDLDRVNVLNSTSSGGLVKLPWRAYHVEPLALNTVQQCLRDTFLRVDENFSKSAFTDVKNILSGHEMTEEMRNQIMAAKNGACGISALVEKDRIHVACTGDCRAVLGVQTQTDNWKAVSLSVDQNFENTAEVERLRQTHSKETVIKGGRLLGCLAPFRAFGDVNFKWDLKYLDGFLPVYPGYRTPPYLTAEPVVSQIKRTEQDRFLILATDGLWDTMSNELAVSVVSRVMKVCDPACVTEDVSSKTGKNAATHLLYYALGGSDEAVSRMLKLEDSQKRWYRDDITILVIYL